MSADHYRDLHRALRRRQPPEGFADRVMDRVRAGAPATAPFDAPRVVVHRPRVQAWMTAALAVAASVAFALAVNVESQRRDAEGRRAAQDLEVALRIAGEKLHDVQMKITNV